MSYAQLYQHCQIDKLHVGRNFIKEKVLAITGANRIAICKTGLDATVCRGFYLSARNSDHPVVRQHGGHVIAISRDLNRCWTRFVVVKELMHLLDGASSATDSGDSFEKLLTELTGPGSPDRSPQMDAEIECFWRALACLCPERFRTEFADDRRKNHIDDYGIALKLRIPQQYVPHLFSPVYEGFISGLTKQST